MKLIKPDNKNCIADCKTVRVSFNDEFPQYMGTVEFYENNLRLFTLKTEIIRITKDDAIQDAINLAQDNGF